MSAPAVQEEVVKKKNVKIRGGRGRSGDVGKIWSGICIGGDVERPDLGES